jgi:hypothetical protein
MRSIQRYYRLHKATVSNSTDNNILYTILYTAQTLTDRAGKTPSYPPNYKLEDATDHSGNTDTKEARRKST